MKPRSILLVFAALLLSGALASATTNQAAGTTAPAAAAPAAPATATPAAATSAAVSGGISPACAANLSASGLPGSTPAATFLAGPPCGPCSQNPCVNAAYNSGCFIHGGWGACLSPLGDNCSGQPFTWKCQCWSGPLP